MKGRWEAVLTPTAANAGREARPLGYTLSILRCHLGGKGTDPCCQFRFGELLMDEAELRLASDCYGYGRWDAPYWFIGPEQGQASWENNHLTARFEAFRKLSKEGLSDCQSFHNEIHGTRWHRNSPPAALQPTWKFLILLLKTFLKEPADDESRRDYQRCSWGRSTGETCVVELSGLPATSFKVARDREDSFVKIGFYFSIIGWLPAHPSLQ